MGNVHMEATQINYREGGKKMSVAQAIKNAGSEITPEEKTWIDSIPALTTSNAGKTDQDVIAPEFDAESGVYAVGDKVMYDGKLYKFTTAHETPGDWDSTEVSETTVDNELSSLESDLSMLVGISVKEKSTGGVSGNVIFTLTNNGKYSGILLITGNANKCAMYYIYYSGEGSVCEKISGNNVYTVTVDAANGNITATLNDWSKATLISTRIFS